MHHSVTRYISTIKFKTHVYLSVSIGLSDEEKEIQELATNFAANELSPNMQKWDEEVRNIL